jgi:hypothetical protein
MNGWQSRVIAHYCLLSSFEPNNARGDKSAPYRQQQLQHISIATMLRTKPNVNGGNASLAEWPVISSDNCKPGNSNCTQRQ